MEPSSRALASNPLSSTAETQIPDLVKIGAIKTDTLIDVEDYEIRKAYGKKYNETCETVIVEKEQD